ncbi:MAG: hypothetical protein BWZ00_01598 [Bacteroidetes bacterium ADurb.BinA174]|nr:MAG: hypothetical protein BWZ00_01598 [Bacteroidetes bacterium ADurb.BinA174]
MKNEYKDMPFPFGKFNDVLMCDVPNKYLKWIVGEKWFQEKFPVLFNIVKKELKYREQFNINIKE